MNLLLRIGAHQRAAIALTVGSLLSGLGLLALSGWLITRSAQQPPIMYLQMAIVGVRAFSLSRAFLRYLARLRSHDSAFRGVADVRTEIIRRIIPLGPDGVVSIGKGSAHSALVRDADSLHEWALRVVEPTWSHALSIALVLIAIAVVSPITAVVVMVVGAIGLWSTIRWESASSRDAAQLVSPLRAAIADDVHLLAHSYELLAAFDAVDSVRERIGGRDSAIVSTQARVAVWSALTAALWIVAGGSTALVLVVLHPVGDPPLLTALVLLPLGIAELAAVVPGIVDARRRVLAAEARINTAIPREIPAMIPRSGEGFSNIATVSTLTVRDVTATYPGKNLPALSSVSFSARRGDIVVVTGPSGSGKSTLAHVLVRFLDHAGDIRLDTVDIRECDPVAIRRVVGLCEQQPHIFGTTIRHNLDFAKPGSSDDELWDVLSRVRLDEWVRDRGGLDTDLGVRGDHVSGGQAQRIALARVLLADMPVVIVDEPTSQIDRETATALWNDICDNTQDRILIVVTHDDFEHPRVTARVKL